jgi:hypothetical protein
MDREIESSNRIFEIEEEFRRVRESTIVDYEGELERAREEEEIMARKGETYSEEVRRVMTENDVDAERLFRSLAKGWSRQQREFDAYLEERRPRLLEAEPNMEERAREDAAQALFVAGPEWSQAHFIGADVLAPDAESIGGYEGEIGNPGIWLYPNAAPKVGIKDKEKGSGSGCVGRPVPVPVTKIWWYSFKPPKPGKYFFWAGVNYHGFYIVSAHDGCFSCKSAHVGASADVEVHQHGWRGTRTLSILNLGSQHINKSGLLQGSQTWKFYEALDTSPVTVKASVAIQAQAKGSASYAEVNFADGKGAYISAPTMLVSGP